MRLTTKNSESTTSDNHIDRLHASIARNTRNAIEYGALLLATARALGLADEAVEQAPQRAAELRAQLTEITRRDAASTTRLAQIRAILAGILSDANRESDADNEVALAQELAQILCRYREHLNRKQGLVDELRRQMDRLTAQNLEQSLALEEIRAEVEGDA